MANEGPGFTPQNITTDADFTSYVQNYFPDFSEDDISSVLDLYASSEDTNPSAANYSTLGYAGPSALELSGFANGQQQRANVRVLNKTIYSEHLLTFTGRICKLKSHSSARLTGFPMRSPKHGNMNSQSLQRNMGLTLDPTSLAVENMETSPTISLLHSRVSQNPVTIDNMGINTYILSIHLGKFHHPRQPPNFSGVGVRLIL